MRMFLGGKMSLFDKAKAMSDKVVEKAIDFSSDELLADTIIKAVEKQEKVNAILQEKGSNYRINDMELGMSIPPTVVFGISRVSDETNKTPKITGEESTE